MTEHRLLSLMQKFYELIEQYGLLVAVFKLDGKLWAA
jgi:hypothetical protein